jgi:glycosyltransferase 2 family protein
MDVHRDPAPPDAGPPGRSSLGAAAAAAAAAVAAVALGVAVSDHPAPAWELDVVEAATRLPDVVGYPLRAVMQVGTVPAAIAVGLLVWFLVDRWRPAVTVTVAGLVVWFIVRVAKVVVDRDRPSGIRIREEHDTLGFPSGHTAVAVALAVTVAPLVPRRWRWVPYLVAALVGVARLHVGAHFPLDVVGGALIGLAGAFAIRAATPGR